MKITKSYLKQLIKEELEKISEEMSPEVQKSFGSIVFSINELDKTSPLADIKDIATIFTRKAKELESADESLKTQFMNMSLKSVCKPLTIKILEISNSLKDKEKQIFNKEAEKGLVLFARVFSLASPSGQHLANVAGTLSGNPTKYSNELMYKP